MGTISVGGILVTTPDTPNVIEVSKHTSGKYLISINNVGRMTSLLRPHVNYRIELYGDFDEMFAAGDPTNFTIIVNGITYTDFTTLADVYNKLIELITISTGNTPTVVTSGLKKFTLEDADGDWNDLGERIGTKVEFELPDEANIEKDPIVMDDGNAYILGITDNKKYITFTIAPIIGSYIYYQL